MEFKKKVIKFARTSNGIPALWESLRKFPTMERITCIFDQDGNFINPIFNRIGDNSSLIPIRENYLILKLFLDDKGCGKTLLRIINIDCYSNNCEVEVITRQPSDSSEWNNNELSLQLEKDVQTKIDDVINDILK